MVLCGTWGLPGAQTQLKFMAEGAKAEAGVEGPDLDLKEVGGLKGEKGGELVMKKKWGGGTNSVLIKSKADLRPSLPVKVCIL